MALNKEEAGHSSTQGWDSPSFQITNNYNLRVLRWKGGDWNHQFKLGESQPKYPINEFLKDTQEIWTKNRPDLKTVEISTLAFSSGDLGSDPGEGEKNFLVRFWVVIT